MQGLGESQFAKYQGHLRQELQRRLVGGTIDIMMLQEHHLTENCIRRCGPLWARHSEVFWSASFGPFGVQGGLCMSIADSWHSAILERVGIVQGRPQWTMLDGVT